MDEHDEKTLLISIPKLYSLVFTQKYTILGIAIGFVLMAYVYLLLLPKEYISSGDLYIVPEEKQTYPNSFNKLDIEMVQIGIKDKISPDLCVPILKSIPFYKALFAYQVKIDKQTKISFQDFCQKSLIKSTTDIEKKIEQDFYLSDLDKANINYFSKQTLQVLQKRIEITIDKKTDIVSVKVTMPNPLVASQIAQFAIDYLSQYLINLHTKKLTKYTTFLNQKLIQYRSKFLKDQRQKALYEDSYRQQVIRLKTADLAREQNEINYQSSSVFYQELLRKYEEAKLKLEQETPVFQVINPPISNFENVNANKKNVLLIAFILGSFIGIVVVLLKNSNYERIFVLE